MGQDPVDFSVFDEIRPLVVALAPDGTIARWNTACSLFTGYSLDEARGKKVWDFLLPKDEVEAVQGVFAALKSGEFPSSFVNHWVTKSGAKRTLCWSNTCIVDGAGALLFILATGVTIPERERLGSVPKAPLRVRPPLRLNSSFPMWIFDRGTLELLAVNDAALTRYGYTHDEFLSKTVLDVRFPDELASLHEALTHLDEGVQWITHVKHRTKTGEAFRVEIALTPIVFHGRAAAMVLVGTPTDSASTDAARRS